MNRIIIYSEEEDETAEVKKSDRKEKEESKI